MIWEAALPEGRIVSIKGADLQYTIREWNQKVDEQALRDGEGNDQKDEPYLAESLANKTYILDGAILNLLSEGVGFIRLQHILGFPDATALEISFQTIREDPHFSVELSTFVTLQSHLEKPMSGIKSSQPPHILFACKESRMAALEVCPGYSSMSFARHGAIPETYFDGGQNTLYVGRKLNQDSPRHAYAFSDVVKYLSTIRDVQTLSKIEHLAILRELNGHAWDDLVHGSDIHHLDDLLRKLGGVKRLTIVVKHYGDWGTDTDEEVSFIDPVNIELTIAVYESYIPYSNQEDQLLPVEMPGPDTLNFNRFPLDNKVVADQNARAIRKGKSPLVYPPVEYKTAITSSYKKELVRLEMARRNCQARCDAHNTRLKN